MKQPPYKAPAFTLNDSEGTSTSLSDFSGKWLVLYFYPKDDTPGCTTEACSMRDARDEIAKLGAEVVGVSMDEATLHERFKAQYKLNFKLLSDPEKKAIVAYDAWGKKMFGREGILRKTFIINPQGMVVKVYRRVIPLGHGEQIVHALTELQSR
jgi:peroxiredoxin Q/BCP